MAKVKRVPKRRHKPAPFVSGRVRILAVLGGILVLLTTAGTYLVTGSIAAGLEEAQTGRLVASVKSAVQGLARFEQTHLAALDRVRGTSGVPQLVLAGATDPLQRLTEPLAANAALDSVILTDGEGVEVLGLQMTNDGPDTGGPLDYRISRQTNLRTLPLVAALLEEDADLTQRPVGLARTPQGFDLYTAGPIMLDDELVGVALVGSALSEMVAALDAGALADVALYLPEGEPLAASFITGAPPPSADVMAQAMRGEVVMQTLHMENMPYLASFAPLAVRGQMLGVIGVFIPDGIFTATEAGRQLLSLVFASLSAAVLVGVLVMVTGVYTRRLDHLRETVDAIQQGDLAVCTGMEASDEVGALGASIDAMAGQLHRRMETLALSLRAQRRETVRLTAVLESVPDGLVVQDRDGRVILMNGTARQMLGSRRVFRDSSLNLLTAVVTDRLGPALAPGIYALGTPVRAAVNNRVLEAQVAAVTVVFKKKKTCRRIGTVIVLRDVTAETRRTLARDRIIDRMAQAVDATPEAYAAPLRALAQGVEANRVSLERMIAELRDLSAEDRHVLSARAAPLSVEELVWGVVEDWKEAIDRAGLRARVMVMNRDMFIRGEARRLRWALGNLIDNAVKYTARGGEIGVVVAKNKAGEMTLTISDSGVGISQEDLPFVWQRFFRGTPRLSSGKVLRRAGSGQGLYIARRVIEAHGGRIDLQSWPGKGTDVHIALALVEPGAARTDAMSSLDTGRYTVAELHNKYSFQGSLE